MGFYEMNGGSDLAIIMFFLYQKDSGTEPYMKHYTYVFFVLLLRKIIILLPYKHTIKI